LPASEDREKSGAFWPTAKGSRGNQENIFGAYIDYTVEKIDFDNLLKSMICGEFNRKRLITSSL
jgi:hypothetical protein